MPLLGRRDKRKGGERKQTTLERKTADLREKLAKISFRRNSAPATQGSTASQEQREPEPEYYGSSTAAVVIHPEVLSQLPTPVLELIFDQLSLKELVSSVALVHSTWHGFIVNSLLKQRLAAKLPLELNRHFNSWRGAWPQQAAKFFNNNLISDPGFTPSKFSVASGLGKGLYSSDSWRVPLGCWQTTNLEVHGAELARSSGCEQDLRVLVLNTPSWAAPEATQEVNLLRSLVAEGMTPTAAAAYLDSCPPISFSVWCYCGSDQPSSWHRGYAVVVLDNGRDSGTGWQGVRLGSTMSTSESLAYWISWAPENSLLRGCNMLAKKYISTERGEFRKLSCVFRGYREGVRRAHILLKGLHPQNVYPKSGKEIRPSTEFVAPCLRFVMPEA